MADRTFENQTLHDKLVRSLAKHYSSLGYKGVRADMPGSVETPSAIYWTNRPEHKYIPDITCFKNDDANTVIVAEAETCESLRVSHTAEQWKLFSAHAKSVNGEFHIITPKSCTDEAKKVANELGVIVKLFWTLE